MRERESYLSRVKFITLVIALMAASVFLFSFASVAAAGTMHGKATVVSGQVVSVNSYARTVTVKAVPKAPAEKKAGTYTFSVNGNTWITACAQNRSFFDLGSGERVNVSYHSGHGKLIADNIAIQGTDLATCYVYR